ncbi:unnamed protein product [Lactuca virosa]|uniref:Uncharacterized protein n=1 Tax=Lactuca virosa TaxID=75947 RepID=A0AAU9MUB4_9ASTR|nr:unnamed protein product [Lactuca virosa]
MSGTHVPVDSTLARASPAPLHHRFSLTMTNVIATNFLRVSSLSSLSRSFISSLINFFSRSMKSETTKLHADGGGRRGALIELQKEVERKRMRYVEG